MAQASFAELEHDLKKRRTRRELFLEKMDKLVPWERLERRIELQPPEAARRDARRSGGPPLSIRPQEVIEASPGDSWGIVRTHQFRHSMIEK